MLYKKIEKLLNMKEEFKSRAEFIEIINKITNNKVTVVDDYFKIYIYNDKEFEKVNVSYARNKVIINL